MLSALILSAGRQPAVPLAGQLAHESCVRPGPLVLGTAPLKSPPPTVDRDRHICCSNHDGLAVAGPGHFCLALHVAMQVGPSLHRPSTCGVRRMVSEDSGATSHGVQPFLLIDRTGQIVTAHAFTLRKGSDTYEYCRILGVSSI